MKLYRFKTFRTAYYFPSFKKEYRFLYGLYTPYGLLSKIYWWLFRHIPIIRWINLVRDADKEFPFNKIMEMIPQGSVVSFNMGTPGEEQKISMLGIEANGNRFFSKYSEKTEAMDLSRHEIKVLGSLKSQDIAPKLYDYRDCEGFVFFRTSYIEGMSLHILRLNDGITDLAIRISQLPVMSKNVSEGLEMAFSHGDFTPWNILQNRNEYKIIDWEKAQYRTLGFDIFFFLYQIHKFFNHDKLIDNVFKDNECYITRYFNTLGIDDWNPYMKAFLSQIRDKE